MAAGLIHNGTFNPLTAHGCLRYSFFSNLKLNGWNLLLMRQRFVKGTVVLELPLEKELL